MRLNSFSSEDFYRLRRPDTRARAFHLKISALYESKSNGQSPEDQAKRRNHYRQVRAIRH
jgi:hypothetical protein